MKKVTIEITEKGWTITANVNGKTFTEENVSTSTGSKGLGIAISEQKDCLEELADALDSFAFYDIMCALQKI